MRTSVVIMAAAGLKKAQQAASSIADTIAGALSFQKSLTDLVRGIRNNKGSESNFISQCIQEIKAELKSDDKKAKIIAVQKLTYVRLQSIVDVHTFRLFSVEIEVVANLF